MGYEAFFTNNNNTVSVKILLEHAQWLEALFLLLFLNLIGSIFINKLYSRRKLPLFMLHIAFIFILVAAAVARYVGFDGKMHLRDGETTDYIISEEDINQMVIFYGNELIEQQKELEDALFLAFNESTR